MERNTKINTLSSVSSVGMGLSFGLIFMLILGGASAFLGFIYLILGPFSELMFANPNIMSVIGKVLYFATPIILTGLSVAFAFKTGLFNIGASGQFLMGGVVAIYIGINWTFLGPIHWVVALLVSTLVGAIWGAIPGILKAFRNVHEVVATIMMNYIAGYLALVIMKSGGLLNGSHNTTHSVADSAVIPTAGLDVIFGGNRQISIGILIALAAAIGIYILLEKTTFGYELKAVGHNRNAAKYAGMSEKRNIVISMAIAGALAGAAGAILYLRPSFPMQGSFSIPQQGFDGITVALLGLSSPIGVIFSAIFIAWLKVGGDYIGFASTTFDGEVVNLIISVIIYFSALSAMFISFWSKRIKDDEEGGHQ